MNTKQPEIIVQFATTKDEFRNLLLEFAKELTPKNDDVLKDRITEAETLKILQKSKPTLLRLISKGIIIRYGTPRKPYYFRSEVIQAIRNMYANDISKN